VDELEEAVSGKKATVKPNGQPKPGPIGNTQGIIVPDTAPNPYGNSAPDIKSETPEEKSFLDKAFEMGDIKVLQKASQGLQDKIDGMVEASGYSVPAMVIGSISKAVVEVFMPTNVIDVVPGGKAGSVAKKGADAAKKGKKAKNADGGGGGKDKGAPKKTGEKGKCGEKLAKQDMMQQGFDEVMEVQNNSGHGIDLIGRNSKTGEVKVWEVKTTDGASAPSLSKDQAGMGGEEYTKDRLGRAAGGQGNYGKVPEAMENAEKAQDWMKKAKNTGKPVTYEKREVFIDDISKGCAKNPNKPSQSKPWSAKK
jgi:hypothetical protein